MTGAYPQRYLTMLALHFCWVSFLGVIQGSAISSETRASPRFLSGAPLGHVKDLDEASGICASRVNPNILYGHNDKGDGPKLYAISSLTGELKTTIHVHDAHNYDWEDIACGPCDSNGGHCVYIGEIGDHSGDGAHNIIYKVREPSLKSSDDEVTVDVEAKISFRWVPQQQDCETLMVDPQRNIYLISKVDDGEGRVGVINSSAWDTPATTVYLTDLITLPLSTGSTDPTGGDISPNGRDILIQTHHQVFYWQKADDISIKETLLQIPVGVPFHYNKHAEAVAWDMNGDGYYTVSEGHHENLYYYTRQ